MNRKDLVYLSKINIKSSKFKSCFFIIILTLLFLLIGVGLTFNKSIHDYIKHTITSHWWTRQMSVAPLGTREETIEKLKEVNNKHIVSIFDIIPLYGRFNAVNEENEKIDGGINLYIKYDGVSYKIKKGKDINSDDEIVCSGTIYTNSVDPTDKGIDLNKDISKYLTFNFNKYLMPKNNGEFVLQKTYTKKYKLVGIVDSDYSAQGSECYLTINAYKDVLDNAQSEFESKGEEEFYLNSLYQEFIIDNVKNVEKVKNDLEKQGFLVEWKGELDTSDIDNITNLVLLACLVLSVVSFIIVILFINNTIKENKESISLYHVLGYDKKTIKNIYFTQYVILIFISFIISMILLFTAKLIILNYMNNYPQYKVINVKIDYFKLMLVLLVTILLNYYIINSKKISRT